MALTVLQQPPSIAFSNGPIVVKAKTDKQNKPFIRIVLQCNAAITEGNQLIEYYKEEYSYPISDDGIAVFNIAPTLKTAIKKGTDTNVNKNNITQNIRYVSYALLYKEIYYENAHEVVGSSQIQDNFIAISGGLTDYERLSMSDEDVSTIIGPGRIFSRKPDGELLTVDSEKVVSIFKKENVDEPYKWMIGSELLEESSVLFPKVNDIKIVRKLLSGLAGKALYGKFDNLGRTNIFFISPSSKNAHHFLFINGMGVIENATAFSFESLTFNVESEEYIYPQEISFQGINQRASYKDLPFASFKVSSGPTNNIWADWWINEFIASNRHWMKIAGNYLPVVVAPDSKLLLYDKAKPGLITVAFTVTLSFSGGTENLFINQKT